MLSSKFLIIDKTEQALKALSKILVVDDLPQNIEIIIDILEQEGNSYELLQALSGTEALQIAKEEVPDLAICDWEMPLMNGIELTRALKADPVCKDIPVIMCTGQMTSPADLQMALDSGAVDYIRKPIEPIELVARVNSTLKLNRYFKEKVAAEQKYNGLLKENLEAKTKQLSSVALQIVNHNNTINKLLDALVSLHKEKVLPMPEYLKLKSFISEQLNVDKDWEQFMLFFNQADNESLLRLQEQFPSLTQYDLRFCTYLKLSLGTTDIARLLHITPDSVKKSRQRLRKKLSISPDMDLENFLKTV